jgi:hypothetical protein
VADAPWATAASWLPYCQQLHPSHAHGHIDLDDKLLLCGETISSDIAASKTGVNSFVYARLADGHAGAAATRSFGRVSYYVQHRVKGRCHSLAVVRWYDRATPGQLHKLWPNYVVVHAALRPARRRRADTSTSAAAAAEHPSAAVAGAGDVPASLSARLCAASLERWSVLQWQCRHDFSSLLPVHNIAGRWMPSLADPQVRSAAALQYGCPLRTCVYE